MVMGYVVLWREDRPSATWKCPARCKEKWLVHIWNASRFFHWSIRSRWKGWQRGYRNLRFLSILCSMYYFESLLMTRMSAPFSSFSRWLSDFRSVKTCLKMKDKAKDTCYMYLFSHNLQAAIVILYGHDGRKGYAANQSIVVHCSQNLRSW